jgi:hypothetical protein
MTSIDVELEGFGVLGVDEKIISRKGFSRPLTPTSFMTVAFGEGYTDTSKVSTYLYYFFPY